MRKRWPQGLKAVSSGWLLSDPEVRLARLREFSGDCQ